MYKLLNVEQMRTKALLSALFFCLLLAACKDDSIPTIEVSPTAFTQLTGEAQTLEISISTTGEWRVTDYPTWCTPLSQEGKGEAVLQLAVSANISGERNGTVTIWGEEKSITVSISQEALSTTEEYTYRLPVICHVLYKDPTNPLQYISQKRITQIIERVNSLYDGEVIYKGGSDGVDMNLQFVLAETDEDGNKLDTPGVEYILRNDIPMNYSTFMTTKDEEEVALVWDPNRYINIFFYPFDDDDDENIVLGVSHIPYHAKDAPAMEGYNDIQYNYLSKKNLGYPYCLSINSDYINEETSFTPTADGITITYTPTDIHCTVAHELGHYLGLHHAFYEEEEGGKGGSCCDTDYCDDTPTYNRTVYMAELEAIIKSNTTLKLSEVVKRNDCLTDETFDSYNIMDYEFSFSDRFTPDQRERIRHTLNYSPLIPGPKKLEESATRSMVDTPIDLPIKYVK